MNSLLKSIKLGEYDIVALYSAGLDSRLAVKLLAIQNISVLGVEFLHPFMPGLIRMEKRFYHEEQLDADILEIPLRESYLKTILKAEHGCGSCANPCIDCKIFFFRRAWEIALKVGAKCIATGEIIGQRPFSQRGAAIQLIETEANLTGKVVRPLCAKLIFPSEAEQSGFIDRSKLIDIHGRSRKMQISLADKLGISDYPAPAGGCLLTDPQYAARFNDAVKRDEITVEMTQLLKFGRHFRIDGMRIVIGRNEAENEIIEEHFSEGRYLLVPTECSGPSALVDSSASAEVVETAASIMARYIRGSGNAPLFKFDIKLNGNTVRTVSVSPADPMWVEEKLICAK